jgi:cyclohexyl-isocyanide hydratase
LILGALGFLDGRPVTAYAPIIEELEAYRAKLVSKLLVIDGHIATASSCLAGQFLSNWLIESLVGADIAHKVKKTIEPLGDESV